MNISSEEKRKLHGLFCDACNSYKDALERMWDLNPASGYWIGDEVGGLYDNDGFVTISLLDMIYVVENDITWKEFDDWTQYNIKANEFKFNYIKLEAWHLGCPRVPKETFDRLDGLKQELVRQIKKEGDNIHNGDYDEFGF